MSMRPLTTVDICVCTYRRPQLAVTLGSLSALDVPEGVRPRIVVADNDTAPTARALVEEFGATAPFPVHYVHCPASNISIARNACLDHAQGDFVAFIDDDCEASSGWLCALVEKALETGADAVLGSVTATYDDKAPKWMRQGDFHSTRPVFVGGELLTGYTCNVLIRREAASIAGRRFALALGQTGGEDTDFFTAMHRDGGLIAFAGDALASEPVPSGRARFGWLAKRRFRTGQTHGRLLKAERRTLRAVSLALAKVAYCCGAAILAAPMAEKRNRAVLRGIMHAGVVGGLFGLAEIRLYGFGAAAQAGKGRSNAA
jgi:succinoglycan biosynthesis protein ExoM